MDSSKLAKLCAYSELDEQTISELSQWLEGIRKKAETDEKYKKVLTDPIIPMEIATRKNQGEKPQAMGEEYKDYMILLALAESNNSAVRKEIAKFEYAPDEALRFLAKNVDAFEKMARTTSQNPEQAETTDIDISCCIANNPNTSPYTLSVLTDSIILKYREKIQLEENEGMHGDRLNRTLGKVLEAIVKKENTPDQAIWKINALLRKATYITVEPRPIKMETSAIPAYLGLSLKRLRDDGVDETMRPYLIAYCYNEVSANGRKGLNKVDEIVNRINLNKRLGRSEDVIDIVKMYCEDRKNIISDDNAHSDYGE